MGSWKETCENFIKYLKTQKNLSEHTAQSYRSDLKHFLQYIESAQISEPAEVNLKIIRNYLSQLYEAGYALALNSQGTTFKIYISDINLHCFPDPDT
jgi:site-specific recombinase XerD